MIAAGMDGALPSVVSGLVSSLVMAFHICGVRHSENGMTALRSISVHAVPALSRSIDNGVGAPLRPCGGKVRTGHKD